MKYLKLTWDDIEKQCEELYYGIKKSGFKPDMIVGIARGGWMPARILSDMLNLDELYTMRIKFYTSIDQRARKPVIIYPVPLELKGKKVLLVDDIADTGESLELAKKHLNEHGAEDFLAVTLVKKTRSKVTPDIFAVETSAWVVFPWEVNETIRCIIRDNPKREIMNELEKAGIMDVYQRRKKGFSF